MLRIRLMEDENGLCLFITINPITDGNTGNLVIAEREET